MLLIFFPYKLFYLLARNNLLLHKLLIASHFCLEVSWLLFPYADAAGQPVAHDPPEDPVHGGGDAGVHAGEPGFRKNNCISYIYIFIYLGKNIQFSISHFSSNDGILTSGRRTPCRS